MTHEKIFKRPDGSRVALICRVRTTTLHGPLDWGFTALYCPPKKRKYVETFDREDSEFKAMTPQDKFNFVRTRTLEYLSVDEINSALDELWELNRPDVLAL